MNTKQSPPSVVPGDHELTDLSDRALQHRPPPAPAPLRQRLFHRTQKMHQVLRQLPRRYLLHLLVVVLAIVTLGIGSLPLTRSAPPAPEAATQADHTAALQRPLSGPVGMAPAHSIDSASDAPLTIPNWDLPIQALSTRDDRAGALAPDTADGAPAAAPAQPIPGVDEAQPVSANQATAPAVRSAVVTAEKANLRTGPGTDFEKVVVLAQHDPLTVQARHEQWVLVDTLTQRHVWIAADLVDLSADELDLVPIAQDVPPPPPPLVAETTVQNLNLRDGPGTDYIGMQKLPLATPLDLLVKYGDWFRVQTPEGATGWVTGEYLAMLPGVPQRVPVTDSIPSANPTLVGSVTDTGVHLRTGPGKKYESLGTLTSGAEMTLLAQYEGWYKVTTTRGTTGWMSGDFVAVAAFIKRRIPSTTDIPALPQPKPQTRPQTATRTAPAPAPAGQPAPAPAGQPAGDAGGVVGFALQFTGAPYVWGAAGPRAFDCSGFTQYVYKQFGLSLPHSAEMQYSSRYGSFISSRESLLPGDLVFFVNTYKPGISHVGIYIGNGNVVQAMSPALGVGIASIYGSYWNERYYGGVRPFR